MALYDHPAFQGINKDFLIYMDKTLQSVSKSKDSTAILAAIMAISNEAKRYNVSLTPERQKVLIMQLRNGLPQNKRAQFDAFISMLQNKL